MIRSADKGNMRHIEWPLYKVCVVINGYLVTHGFGCSETFS